MKHRAQYIVEVEITPLIDLSEEDTQEVVSAAYWAEAGGDTYGTIWKGKFDESDPDCCFGTMKDVMPGDAVKVAEYEVTYSNFHQERI